MRRSLHPLIRELHLLGGLLLAVVVLFYTVSGMAISYARWLPAGQPRLSTEQVPLGAPLDSSGTGLRNLVTTAQGGPGRLQGLERLDGNRLRIRRDAPASRLEAEATIGASFARLSRTDHDPARVLRGLHVLSGRTGGPAYTVWALLLDLTALAVIGFAVSGIYLWYRLARDRRLGWVILACSWGYTLTMVGYLALS